MPPEQPRASPIQPHPCAQLRDFLHNSLAHPDEGYFAQGGAQSAIGKLKEPIRFDLLLGESGWRAQQSRLYRELQTSWLTPAELFHPWYGEAVARCIVRHHMKHALSHDLAICEIGGGQGTLAASILNYLKRVHPGLYERTTYTAVDVSAALAHAQKRHVAKACGHADRFRSILGDARQASTWGDATPAYTHVLAMEVLDNLPHDRVVRTPGAPEWAETWVVEDVAAAHGLREEARPLQDALIRRCLDSADWEQPSAGAQTAESVSSSGALGWLLDTLAGVNAAAQAGSANTVFLPTGALQLFEALHAKRPHHNLICADFTWLADVQIDGANAPLVSATAGGRNRDYDTYLLPRGQADIFFPSNLPGLRELWLRAASSAGVHPRPSNAKAHVLPTSEFMTLHAETHRTKTAGAFNPLTDDFLNTGFLLCDSRPPPR